MKNQRLFKRFLASWLLLAVSALSWAHDFEPGFSIWDSAVKLTGLDAEFSKTIDPDWDGSQYLPMSVYSADHWDYCLVPQEKKLGHTWFILSDATLASQYGITSLQALYDKARNLYGGDALNVNDPANASKFKKNDNPLYRLIAYHTLKGKADYSHLTTICTIETSMTNPTEWYGTMDGGNLLKVEHITVERDIIDLDLDVTPSAAVKKIHLFLNHLSDNIESHPNIRGAKVLRPDEDNIEVNKGENFFIYELDRLVDYTAETQSTVFNKVMRMDLYTMFPELMTNRIRSDVTSESQAVSNSKDALCKNYWFPKGYIDGLQVNDDAIFLYQGPHNFYWCYEGDEFDITSNTGNYDVTMEIPPLPEGRYQIRLGFANMPTRGVCQFYYDGEPIGTPFDMRSDNFEQRTGWEDIWSGRYPYETPTTEAALEVLKKMHNRGWYHGPEDVFWISGEGHEDGDPTITKNYFSRLSRACRYVLGNQPIEIKSDGKKHTIRIKSVQAAKGTVIMLDYLEFVPESEWGDYDPSSSVYDFEQNGIYYIKNDSYSVSVAPMPKSQGQYSGNLEIPTVVIYEGYSYDVADISANAFNDCEELRSIVIPRYMTTIPDYAFWNSGLVSVTLKSPYIVSKDYTSYHGAKLGTLSLMFGEQVKEIVIDGNITEIGAYAFADFSNLTSITIPERVTYIGRGAFYNCPSLTSVTLNSNAVFSSSRDMSSIFGEQVKEYIIGH